MISIRVISVLCIAFLCNVFPVSSKHCPGVHIRNKVSNLEKLRNCTQILGSLQIALIERVESESEFDDYVFPELTHITGYLMFFSVSKLKSIGQLFPNLKAIRGAELLADYALIIYRMPDLKEIGTTNLLIIGRGYVKVDRCPLICNVNTVNWEKLGDNVKLHYNAMIESDIEEKEMESQSCKPCPAECGGYCWNAMHCQDLEADKCHEECLGCYKEQSSRHCDVCTNYEYNGECVPECPPGTYYHTISNKCVTEEQCRSNMDNTLKGSWWPFGRECVNDCPGNYQKTTDKDGKVICVICGTNCIKQCKVTQEVNAIEQLQKLKGCTHIQGSLAIRLLNIDPRRIIGDISEYLGSIRYIRDSLIIGRSEGITTLAVLKNLRMIEGKHLNNKYALFVYDNPNLQQLWNFSDPSFKLEIKNGTVVFHDNPLLCVSEILQLANATGMNYSQVDVSMYSNGDKAVCNKSDIAVDVDVTNYEVNIFWKEKPCNGLCIGYTLFYRIVEMDETVTTFDSKDVCTDNVWNSIFTSKTSVVLRELKAYTRYAFYIKRYHEKSRQDIQSDIKYFVTKPDSPETPMYVEAHAINSHIITLQWKRPVDVNGNLGKYIVHVVAEEDRTDLSSLRNYCENPWSLDGTIIDMDSGLFQTNLIESEQATKAFQGESDSKGSSRCFCKDEEERVAEYSKTFKRDITLDNCDDHGLSKFGCDECRNYKYKGVKSIQKRSDNIPLDRAIYIEPNITAYNITNLKHFTMYVFYLSACNEISGMYGCSAVEQTFERTVRKEDADDVHDVEVHIQDSNVHITWSEPKNPNSMILAYKIIYNETSTENSTPITTCIPRDDKFNGSSWVLNYLSPGTYLIKVQAVSLAGPGRESEEISFVIAEPRKLTTTVILWVCVSLVAIFLVGLIVYFWWKRKHPSINFSDISPEYHGLQYEPDNREIERSDIELDTNLSHGTF